MPLYLDDFIEILAELCEEKNLKIAVSESFKGGLLTGLSAIFGGLLLGPLGLALGGALGGGAAALSARNKFLPVARVLLGLTPAQKKKLYEKVKYAFRDFNSADMTTIIMLLTTQLPLKELAINVVKDFLRTEMSLRVLKN